MSWIGKKCIVAFFLFFTITSIPKKTEAAIYESPTNGRSVGGIEFLDNEEESLDSTQEIDANNNGKLPTTGEYWSCYLSVIGISVILSAYLYKKIEKEG